ncbi:MAG: pyruvate, phosphate dikinase, partial [Phycisphaerales bacterium]
MTKKYVYDFGEKRLTPENTLLLGNKGVQLSEMSALGLPIPPGFTISTETCIEFLKSGKWMEGLDEQVEAALSRVEKKTGMTFGKGPSPLLVSVRSGSYVSMPGMMDTVLNLGLNDDVVELIIKKTGNARFAYDIYRRFIDMFGDVVMGCHHEHFEEKIDAAKKKAKVKLDSDLNAGQLKDVVAEYKAVYKKHVGELFPQDARVQLQHAINAVFSSWNIERAVKYRQINKLRDDAGTAVNVQAMAFGNMGEDCGTGVCFTRNPSTGEKEFYGEFLMNAQGEDVVAGIRTPMELKKLSKIMPKIYEQLTKLMTRLEKHYKDMQDMEFTIQEKKLYILQTRTGKRTAEAAVKMAVDMVNERLITKKTAVTRVKPEQLDRLLHPHFDPKARREVIAKGLPASPGAAVGQVVFTADVAEAWREKGNKVVLVRKETSPEDIGGMNAAEGVLTAFGGMTSHAAVVARGMGKPCVAGVGELNINYAAKKMTVGKLTVKQGDWISLDGSTGEVMAGQLATVAPTMSGDFGQFMQICDQVRRLGIRTNADTPEDARRARQFGAEGIGLCRTEHMFFEGERIWPVRQMILAADDYAAMLAKQAAAATEKEKKAIAREHAAAKKQFEGALKTLLPYQRSDFVGIFKAMAGLPVTVRLLDPPLHEFLPQDAASQAEMAKRLGVKPAVVKAK